MNGTEKSKLAQKMFELEAAYREIDQKDRELLRYKMNSGLKNGQTPASSRSDYERENEKDREITKLQYTVSRLEERLKIAKVESENAKRDLVNEQEGRKVIDKKLKALEKENKDLRSKMSTARVKLGVANANYSVGKHETDELRKAHQEHQILIARLEERLRAANQELERLRNPLNPTGSEQVKRKVTTEKKELKKLKVETERLESLRVLDQQRLIDTEEENRSLKAEINRYKQTVENLETSLEMAELTVEAERRSRAEFETQNVQLRSEKEHFDETIKQFKVKLGISNATKNVNVRHAELLKRQEEEHQQNLQNLEKRLRMANAEIERLKSIHMNIGNTADSVQDHNKRLKTHRNNFNMEFLPPRSLNTGSRSGWTPTRGTPKGHGTGDRVSIGSVGSLSSRKVVNDSSGVSSAKPVKHGRTSAP